MQIAHHLIKKTAFKLRIARTLDPGLVFPLNRLPSQQRHQSWPRKPNPQRLSKHKKPRALTKRHPTSSQNRTFTTEEAEQDYQKQLVLLAEQEAEFNAERSNGSLPENEMAVGRKAVQ
jgi:N-acetyl-anhydromuramyl-L-alanine amidase AmpD